MPDVPDPLTPRPVYQDPRLLGGVLALLGALGGGAALGFRVEPEECAVAREQLAAATARLELGAEALGELRTAMDGLRADNARLRQERDDARKECP